MIKLIIYYLWMMLNSKNGDQINSLLNTVRIFSEGIKIEFELSKCGVLIMKRGKVVNNEEINMADGKTIKNIEENGIILEFWRPMV